MYNDNWINEYCILEDKVEKIFNLIWNKMPSESLDVIDIIIISLLKRISNNYKAIKLLFRNELYLESLMVVRSVIESTFVLNGLLEKPEVTYEKLLLLSHNNKKELHKKALDNTYLKANAKKYDFGDLESKYISIQKLSNLSSKNDDLYNISYKMISDEVHINLFSIEKLLQIEPDNRFSIKDNLTLHEVEEPFFTLSYCMFLIESGLNQKYSIGMDKELGELEMLLEKLS